MSYLLDGRHIYVVAEIGINHNGDLERAKRLVSAASACGCDAVKFQKRTVDVVYTAEELGRERKNPFGHTNGALKYGLEFGQYEYDEIHDFCHEVGIAWFASPWDEASVDFLVQYNPLYLKVASPCLTDAHLLVKMASTGIPLIVSTGMSNLETIRKAVSIIEGTSGGKIACLYHCVSTYPSKIEDLNLLGIQTLQSFFGHIPIGYSGHETGVPSSVMACALGATSIERHLTIARSDWGSDQAASLDIEGMRRLVQDIRRWEVARGTGDIEVIPAEEPLIDKLRRKDTLEEYLNVSGRDTG